MKIKILISLIILIGLGATGGVYWYQKEKTGWVAIPTSTPAAEKYFPGWLPAQSGLTISSDGKTAYIPFELDDALLVVDLSTLTITDSIDVSPAGNMLSSSAAVLSPDGKRIYISNEGTKNVMVVNTETKQIEKVLPIKPLHATAISISKDGSKVYLPSSEDGALYVIDTSDNSYRRIFIPGVIFGPVVPSRNDPDLLYVVGMFVKPPGIFQSYFYIFDVSNNTIVRSAGLTNEVLPPHTYARRLIVNPNETMAYFGWMEVTGGLRGVGDFVVFDLNNFKVLASVSIENGVSDFAVNENTDRAYIIGFWSGGGAPQKLSIQEYDISTNKVVRSIPVSPSSDQRAIVIDPADANYLYMTEGDFNLIRKMDITTGKEVAKLQFNKADIQPYAIIRGDDMGYIISRLAQSVYKLDLNSGQLIASIKSPLREGGGWGFYQGNLYAGAGNTIYAIKASTGKVIKKYSIATEFSPITFTFFGDKMVAIDYETAQIAKRLLIFDAKTMSILKSIDLPREPHGDKVIVSPDSSKFYISRGSMVGTTVITVFDASTLEIINTIEIPSLQLRHGASYFPEADFDEVNRILYLTGGASVYKIDMDTDKLIGALNLIDAYGGLSGIRWSPTAICGVALSPSKEKLFAFSADAHSLFIYDLIKSSWSTKIINLGGYSRDCDAVISLGRQYFYTANSQSDNITMVNLTSGEIVKIIELGK